MDDGNDSSQQTKTSKSGDEEEGTVTTIAMVTPSGHLYGKQAIYEYLLTKNAEYKEKLAAFERQKQDEEQKADTTEASKRQRQEAFDDSHQLPQHRNKKSKPSSSETGSNSVLKRTSYWLPDMQPDKVDAHHKEPDRPVSPYSGSPLRRKDLRELELKRKPNSEDVLCAISGKAIRMQPTLAYWVKDKNRPGVVVLKDVYDLTISNTTKEKGSNKTTKLICPVSNLKIKHTIELKSGGSGFAAHNAVEVKTYNPTIT